MAEETIAVVFDALELAEIEAALETHLGEDLRGWPRDGSLSDREWAEAVLEAGDDPDDDECPYPLVSLTMDALAKVAVALTALELRNAEPGRDGPPPA